MHKLDGPVDLKEASILARRRDEEVQRQNRIFNTRVRTIGIDQQALDAQIQDKKIQDETEARKHIAFAKDLIRHDQTMCLLDDRHKHDVININKAVSEYRICYQKPETRREFDLNDPQALKKDVPARISDTDPRCTVSSIQKFTGEDINRQERISRQQEQIREWSLAQQNELKNALEDQKFANRLYDNTRIALDRRICELQQMEEDTRRAVTITTKDFNCAQRMEEEERQVNAEWDRRRANDARAAVLLERQQKRIQRQLRKDVDCQNILLCKDHKERERFLKNEVYVNVPTAKYFDQYNTTSR
ncbi:RIB43A-like with coiled-coils protein 2 isoform X3 [Rhinoraja longicauda]